MDAFVTPACLLTGVLFPDIAKHGVPYVTYAFAFMTFIGALKSRFRDVADVFKRPLPLILMLLILHVLGPVAACGLGHLLFPGNMNYITGMVLEFSVPAAVISLMWVSIYNGNSPLSLSLVVIDTILAPFLIPAVLKLLVGSSVKMDTVGMMKELVFMIALPAVLAMCLNEVSHGKVMETWPKKLAPFSKMCLIFVVTSNSSKVSPYMKHLNGETAGGSSSDPGPGQQGDMPSVDHCHSYKTEQRGNGFHDLWFRNAEHQRRCGDRGSVFSGGNIISGYDRNVISADPGGFLWKYDAPGPDRTAGKGEGAWSFSMN